MRQRKHRNPAPPANPAAALLKKAKEQADAIAAVPLRLARERAAAERRELAAAVNAAAPGPPEGYAIAGAGTDPFASIRAAARAAELLAPPDGERAGAPPIVHTGIDYRYAGRGKRRLPPLPPAEVIANRLGFIKVGGGWRGPRLCCGGSLGDHIPQRAGFSLYVRNGETLAKCHYGCRPRDTFAALRNALGMSGAVWTAAEDIDAAPPPPLPKGKQGRPPPTAAEWRKHRRRNAERFQRPPAGVPLIEGTGWPLLLDAGLTGRQRLAAIPGEWIAWHGYTLADGTRDFVFRRFGQPGGATGPKSFWTSKPQGAPERSHSGLSPDRFQVDANPALIIIAEGEQAAWAWATAGLGVIAFSANATSGMATLNLDDAWAIGLPILIAPDFDANGAGAKAAQALYRKELEAGAPAESIGVIPLDIVARVALNHGVAPADLSGIDGADLTPAGLAEIIAATLDDGEMSQLLHTPSVQRGEAKVGTNRILPRPAQRGAFACPARRRWRYPDRDGGEGTKFLACRKCDFCAKYLCHCDMLRYRAGIQLVGAAAQTLISYRYDTPKECRRFRAALRRRVKRFLGRNLPHICVSAANTLTVIFAAALPAALCAAIAAALARVGKGTIDTRELSPTEFSALIPADRKQHTHLDGEGEEAPILAVKFNHWPAYFDEDEAGYGMGDGYLDKESPAPGPLEEDIVTPLIKARRHLGPEWAAWLHAGDWLRDKRVAAELAAELIAAEASKGKVKDAAAEGALADARAAAAESRAAEVAAGKAARAAPADTELAAAAAAARKAADADRNRVYQRGKDARNAASKIYRNRRDAAVGEIRAATGYAGPRALLVDSVNGRRDVHSLVRMHWAGQPPELAFCNRWARAGEGQRLKDALDAYIAHTGYAGAVMDIVGQVWAGLDCGGADVNRMCLECGDGVSAAQIDGAGVCRLCRALQGAQRAYERERAAIDDANYAPSLPERRTEIAAARAAAAADPDVAGLSMLGGWHSGFEYGAVQIGKGGPI